MPFRNVHFTAFFGPYTLGSQNTYSPDTPMKKYVTHPFWAVYCQEFGLSKVFRVLKCRIWHFCDPNELIDFSKRVPWLLLTSFSSYYSYISVRNNRKGLVTGQYPYPDLQIFSDSSSGVTTVMVFRTINWPFVKSDPIRGHFRFRNYKQLTLIRECLGPSSSAISEKKSKNIACDVRVWRSDKENKILCADRVSDGLC